MLSAANPVGEPCVLRSLVVAAALVLGVSGAAAEPTAPNLTAQSLYDEGARERKAANPAAAVRLLSLAVAHDPDNADIRLELGLAFIAEHLFEAAEQELNWARALAPGYVDVEMALVQLDLLRGRQPQGALRLMRLARAHPQRTDLATLVRDIESGAQKMSPATASGLSLRNVDASVSYSRLSGNRTPWREATLNASFLLAPREVLSLSVAQASRFARDDTYGEIRFDGALAQNIDAYVTLGGTTYADFKPEALLAAGVTWRPDLDRHFGSGMSLSASAKRASYTTGSVHALVLGAESEMLDGALALAVQQINVVDETESYEAGYGVQLKVRPLATLILSGGWADAPDNTEGRTFRTRSIFLGAQIEVSPRVVAHAVYAHDELEGLYDRTTGTLSLSYRLPRS